MSKRSRLLPFAAAVVALAVVALLLALRGERTLGPALDSAEKPAQRASTETKRASSAAEEEASSTSEEPSSSDSPAPETPASTSESSGESEGEGDGASEKPLYTVEGEVLDQRTDELVPAIHLTLVAGKAREMLLTDERGRFRSTVGFRAGPIAVEVADDGVPVASVELEVAGEGTSWTLPVPIGPTYPVRIEGDAKLARFPAGTWKARIVETVRPDDPPAGLIDVTEDGELRLPDPADELPDRAWPWRRLRAGELPWLRYAEVHHPPDGRYRVMLELRGLEAGVAGRGEGFGTVGIREEVSVLPRDPVASVEGHVSSGDWVAPRVLLVPPDDRPKPSETPPHWYEAVTEHGGGDFAFEGVLPGRWKLVAYAGSHVVSTTTLDLGVGLTRLDPIVLQEGQYTTLDLAYVVADSGDHRRERQGYRLRLREASDYARAWYSGCRYEGALHWSAVHLGLPDGAYELEAVAHGRPPRWKPYRVELDAPVQDDGVLRGIPKAETVPFRIRVVYGETGELAAPYDVHFGPEGVLESQRLRGPWALTPDVSLQWSVWKSSYAPAFGTEAHFEQVGPERVARAELFPGWGVELLFRAANPGDFATDPYPWSLNWTEPGPNKHIGAMAAPRLPGVRVLESGAHLGTSDQEGALRIALDHQPPRLELRAPGWRLVDVTRWRPGAWILWMDRR